jgi:hypothetical protein
MKTEIVIARYNEDLSWLKKIPKSIKITIYNKGVDNIENLEKLKYNIIKLPNVGRESHTYLYHIINNYDKLADKTIFCQGDSIFHSPGFLDLLKNIKLFEPVQPLSAFYWPEGEQPFYFYNPPKPVLDETKNLWIKKNPIHVEYLDNNFVTKYPYFYQQSHYIKLVELTKKLYNIDNVFKFFVERFRLKNVDLDDLFPVCYAALFCINKEVILENSVDFYNNIMSMLLYDFRYNTRYYSNHTVHNSNTKPVDWGLYLEKLWLVIFNYKKHNKHYINLKTKDFPVYNYQLKVKQSKNTESIIHFKLFIIVCEIYLNLLINNDNYSINITKNIIYLKHNTKTLLKINPIPNINIQNKIKNMSYVTVEIKLVNNNLIVSVNNYIVINYHLENKVNKINSAKIFSLTDNNKFIDLLNPNSTNRELEKKL